MVYVGSAMSFDDRRKAHFKDLHKGKHVNSHLQSSFNKHGEEAFKFEQVEVIDGPYDKAIYFAKENALMEELKSKGFQLYNIAKAQGGWTFHTLERKAEIAAKISSSVKSYTATLSEDERRVKFNGNPNGPDEATRVLISATMKGVKKTAETRAKMKMAQNREERKELKRAVMSETGKKNKGKPPPNIRKVILDNGMIFPSLKLAAEFLGISSAWLIHKIRKNQLGKYYTDPTDS